MTDFDLDGYRRAVLGLDAERWLSYYAPDAQWTEYRPASTPRSPHVMRGHKEIGAFLRAVAAEPLSLAMSNEVVGDQRVADTLIATLPDQRRIIENVVLELLDGQITTQTEVEAWDSRPLSYAPRRPSGREVTSSRPSGSQSIKSAIVAGTVAITSVRPARSTVSTRGVPPFDSHGRPLCPQGPRAPRLRRRR